MRIARVYSGELGERGIQGIGRRTGPAAGRALWAQFPSPDIGSRRQ